MLSNNELAILLSGAIALATIFNLIIVVIVYRLCTYSSCLRQSSHNYLQDWRCTLLFIGGVTLVAAITMTTIIGCLLLRFNR